MAIEIRFPLDAPTESVSPTELARLREYLDGQSAVALAVWIRHEHQGREGEPSGYDHHTMLGIPDERYVPGKMGALELGIERECHAPGWLDLFPLSEVEELRAFGEVLWEQPAASSAGLDPLDFRFS